MPAKLLSCSLLVLLLPFFFSVFLLFLCLIHFLTLHFLLFYVFPRSLLPIVYCLLRLVLLWPGVSSRTGAQSGCCSQTTKAPTKAAFTKVSRPQLFLSSTSLCSCSPTGSVRSYTQSGSDQVVPECRRFHFCKKVTPMSAGRAKKWLPSRHIFNVHSHNTESKAGFY